MLVGVLSNLASTYLAPNLQNRPWIVYLALIITFLLSLPLSLYLATHNSHEPSPANTSAGSKEEVRQEQAAESPLRNPAFPEKAYREFVGREALIGDITAALRDSAGKWIIGIDGMGGIGKTALAREITDRCYQENLFSEVVWAQAPKEQGRLENDTGVRSLTYETVLDTIGRQLGILDIPETKMPEKENRVRALIKRRRVLIVLDNMETAREDQNEVAQRLWRLLNPGKAIMTSRHRFSATAYAVHLQGLEVDAALRLIRIEAQEKNITRVSSAADAELKKIVKSTGGSPLAIKLVIGQLFFLPPDAVLKQLQEVNPPTADNDESDYVSFYKIIFMPSWRLLSENGKKLLVFMTRFVPNIGGTYEAVQRISGFPEEILPASIEELWRLSFLEIGESQSLKKSRYYLHALTQYFVLSDIIKALK